MRKSRLLAVPGLLLFAGCNLDPVHAPRPDGDKVSGPADPERTDWEPLPEGRSYLVSGMDSSGTPLYTPVRLLDTMALVEGDILIACGKAQMEKLRAELVDPKEARPAALAKSSGYVRTSTYTGGANAWPGGFIPYIIAGGVNRSIVELAVYEFNQTGSGITFVPQNSTHAQGVVFRLSPDPNTSTSAVGLTTPGQYQWIFLAAGASKATILHEMGHAAGMYHEHVRPDRDTYVTLSVSGSDQKGVWARDYSKLFDGTTVGDYDYNSIMHYVNRTVTYTNPDGSLYQVTLTAKNGQATGNTQLSFTDKVSLWGIPVNQNPFHAVSTLNNATGKVIKPYTTVYDGAHRRWLLTYDPTSGNANVTALNDDNSWSHSVQNLGVGSGFNIVLPYNSGNGTPCMLFYNTSSGQVKLYNVIAAGGALHPAILYSGFWNAGWTTLEFYETGGKRFWFFQNASNQLVHIWSITATGLLGPQTMNTNWPGWNYFKPFHIETSYATNTAFFLFRTSNGLTRIRQMNNAGTLGPTIADLQLPAYPTVGLWQSVTKAYLALANGDILFIYDLDNTGFRNTGSPLYRVHRLPRAVAKIEASAILSSKNNGGISVNNKVFDYKQILTIRWAGLPNFVFTGAMAPFR